MKKRPNIIIFNPDQMRADTLNHLGNNASITPNLDEFSRKDAVSFRNAFCQNPVCVPSRISFLTGLYPHTTGHRTMGYLLHEHETSLLKELKEAGYYVWANARNDLIAGQIDGLVESHVTEMFYGGNNPGHSNSDNYAIPTDRGYYSFYSGKIDTVENEKYLSADDEDIEAAVDRILNPVDDRPLCIFLGLMYPHPPYEVEEPFFSAIDREKLQKRIKAEDTKDKSKILELLRKYQNIYDFSEEEWNEIRAVYLGMCMKVDEQFKKICDALKEKGEYDNTAIFFFSDHGDYTGDYSLTEKAQNSFEDCLTNIPLLIKPPKDFDLDSGITDSFAELVDFYATALEFADVTPSHGHFGKTLSPILKNRNEKIRTMVFSEGGRLEDERRCGAVIDPKIEGNARKNIYWARSAAQWDNEGHAKGTMIRTENFKYVFRANAKCEFYDLKNDPYEKINEIENPIYDKDINDMKSKLLVWYQNTCDVVPFEVDKRFSKTMIWEKVKNICPVGFEEDVKNKIDNGMDLFLVMDYCKKI